MKQENGFLFELFSVRRVLDKLGMIREDWQEILFDRKLAKEIVALVKSWRRARIEAETKETNRPMGGYVALDHGYKIIAYGHRKDSVWLQAVESGCEMPSVVAAYYADPTAIKKFLGLR